MNQSYEPRRVLQCPVREDAYLFHTRKPRSIHSNLGLKTLDVEIRTHSLTKIPRRQYGLRSKKQHTSFSDTVLPHRAIFDTLADLCTLAKNM